MNDDDTVRLHIEDGIATVTIDRPLQRNALSVAAANRLHALWERIDADDAVRVAVLTSADCGTFCAGLDLQEAASLRAERGIDILTLMKDPFHGRMRELTKPIVAAMTGHLMAGGMMLAVNSDLRVGLAGTRAGITEARVGRGVPWLAPMLWMVPQPFLMEMVLTGDTYPIERFEAFGFVNHLEPTPDAVRARAASIATRIRDNAPLSVKAAKATVLAAMSSGSDAGLALSRRFHREVYASDDAREGPLAFAQKRPPVWTGR
jgi:enoyl-CoA hydratase